MARSKTIQTITINKRISVDIEEDVDVSSSDIMEAIENLDDMEAFLCVNGYIRIEDLGMHGSVSCHVKLEIMKRILQKVTITQLENFEKSL